LVGYENSSSSSNEIESVTEESIYESDSEDKENAKSAKLTGYQMYL